MAMKHRLTTYFAGVRTNVKSFDSVIREEDCIANFVDQLINRIQLGLVQIKIL